MERTISGREKQHEDLKLAHQWSCNGQIKLDVKESEIQRVTDSQS